MVILDVGDESRHASVYRIYREIAQTDNLYSTQQNLKAFAIKPKTEVVDYKLGINEVVIGFKTPEFRPGNEQKVDLGFMKINKESGEPSFDAQRIVIAGSPGTGKTWMLDTMIAAYHTKFEIRHLHFDPKKEYWTRRFPIWADGVTYKGKFLKNPFSKPLAYQQKIDLHLAQFGMKRKGYDLYIVRPLYLGEEEGIDKHYCLTWLDVMQLWALDPKNAPKYVAEVLGLTGSKTNKDILTQAMSDPTIRTWVQAEARIGQLVKDASSTASLIFQAIKTSRARRVISDDLTRRFDFLAEIALHDTIVFAGELPEIGDEEDEDDKIYNGFCKWLIKLLEKDVYADIRRNKSSKYPAGVLLSADEADAVAGKKGQTLRRSFVRAYNKLRGYGFNTLLATQELQNLDSSLITNASTLISSRATRGLANDAEKSGGNLDAIKSSFRINSLAESALKDLPVRVQTTIGTIVSGFAILRKDKAPEIVFPEIPPAQPMETTTAEGGVKGLKVAL